MKIPDPQLMSSSVGATKAWKARQAAAGRAGPCLRPAFATLPSRARPHLHGRCRRPILPAPRASVQPTFFCLPLRPNAVALVPAKEMPSSASARRRVGAASGVRARLRGGARTRGGARQVVSTRRRSGPRRVLGARSTACTLTMARLRVWQLECVACGFVTTHSLRSASAPARYPSWPCQGDRIASATPVIIIFFSQQ